MAEAAGTTIVAVFESRRQADLALEHLVQDLGIERTDVFIAAAGADSSAGDVIDGADAESGHPGVEANGEPALAGGISLSVDLTDDAALAAVRATLEEFGGRDIASE